MALRIVDGGDLRVGTLASMVYGEPGAGKTTLALSSSRPLLFDFDDGAARAGNKVGKAVVPVREWTDIAHMDASDVEGYDTIVVDTVGTALNKLAALIMQEDPKARTRGGQLSLPGYGALKGRFSEWLAMVRGYGKDIVLVAHGEEVDRNGETFDRIVAPGGSKQEVYQKSDIIGRLHMAADGKRHLVFDPTAGSLGKNVGLPRFVLPRIGELGGFLGTVLADAKGLLNGIAKEQNEETARLERLKTDLAAYSAAEEFNAVMLAMKQDERTSPVDKRILMDAAKAKGFLFDRDAGAFAAAAEPF